MDAFGLPPADGSVLPWWAKDIPLPLGLWAADHIIAPSPTYAREILTPEYGLGLEEFLETRTHQITGILNGIDTRKWNPETDPLIPLNYTQDTLDKRALNKQSLLAEIGLDPDLQLPLIAIISRLDAQKGIDLVPSAFQGLANQPWQAVILASGDPSLETALHQLELDFPGKVRSVIRYDARLSHRIFAAADILLIPSRYEPCGLTQMIAMRYGCIPVARATGGLQDTIQDYGVTDNSTGFLFKNPAANELGIAIEKALQAYRDPGRWFDLQQRGMSQDFSWEKSARQYINLYRLLVNRKMAERDGIRN
ncbi:MAG: hypothetical protein A2W33_09505 [Chloroflexi bacterium RBG_16_52_11]|nr:MAG: hypothetical protein A2W33_09505 [Chloroflexi bacterium RBG_16_52_11]